MVWGEGGGVSSLHPEGAPDSLRSSWFGSCCVTVERKSAINGYEQIGEKKEKRNPTDDFTHNVQQHQTQIYDYVWNKGSAALLQAWFVSSFVVKASANSDTSNLQEQAFFFLFSFSFQNISSYTKKKPQKQTGQLCCALPWGFIITQRLLVLHWRTMCWACFSFFSRLVLVRALLQIWMFSLNFIYIPGAFLRVGVVSVAGVARDLFLFVWFVFCFVFSFARRDVEVAMVILFLKQG